MIVVVVVVVIVQQDQRIPKVVVVVVVVGRNGTRHGRRRTPAKLGFLLVCSADPNRSLIVSCCSSVGFYHSSSSWETWSLEGKFRGSFTSIWEWSRDILKRVSCLSGGSHKKDSEEPPCDFCLEFPGLVPSAYI
jgi:hypothetical protein